MMPPTSIDGTDITGATIDGTDVTEITVDGQTVFTAGPGLSTLVDGFENGNLSNYTVNRQSASVDSTAPVFDGSFSFKTGDGNPVVVSNPGDGLNYYPEAGDKINYYAHPIPGDPRVGFFVDPNLGAGNENFGIEFNNRDGEFEINGQNIVVPTSWSDKWYLVEVDTDTSGNFRVVVYDGDEETDPVKHDVSGSDSNLSNNRGIVIRENRGNFPSAIDLITAEVGGGAP